MTSTTNCIFYAIIIIAILLIIYLFWQKNQEKSYNYREFIANVSNQPQSQPSAPIQNITQPNTNQIINQMLTKVQQAVITLRQDENNLQNMLSSGMQLTPEQISYINQLIDNYNTSITTLNSNIQSVYNILTPAQSNYLNALLAEFNNEIMALNRIISPYTNQIIDLVNYITSASSQPENNNLCSPYHFGYGNNCVYNTLSNGNESNM